MKKHYKELLACDPTDIKVQPDGAQDYELPYSHKRYKDLHEIIPLYKNIPYMMPFIGNKYNEHRILLVCNTYYVPKYDEEKHQRNEEINWWYDSIKNLGDDDEELNRFLNTKYPSNGEIISANSWINPRCHLGNSNQGWPWHKLAAAALEDKKLANKIKEDYAKHQDNSKKGEANWRHEFYRHLALTNYHIRPKTKNDESSFTEQDILESKKVFMEVLKILEPRVICIVHKNLYCSIKEEVLQDINDRIKVHLIYCPISSWFNRKPDMHGKKKFQRLMREHLFTTPKK